MAQKIQVFELEGFLRRLPPRNGSAHPVLFVAQTL
jgi:hypothetical protein